MLKYLFMIIFFSLSVNGIATELPEADLRVISHVAQAKAALDDADYPLAKVKFDTALNLLERAIAGDTSIDLEGKVGTGVFISHLGGPETEETVYNSDLPLPKRAANLAAFAADAAERIGNHDFASQFYSRAGDLHDGDAPAQIWYKKAAENYVALGDYYSALAEADKAGQVAIKFYPQREEFLCLVEDLAVFFSEQADKVESISPLLAADFASRAVRFDHGSKSGDFSE